MVYQGNYEQWKLGFLTPQKLPDEKIVVHTFFYSLNRQFSA